MPLYFSSVISSAGCQYRVSTVNLAVPKTEDFTGSFHSFSPGPKQQTSKGLVLELNRARLQRVFIVLCTLYIFYSLASEQGNGLRKAESSSREAHSQLRSLVFHPGCLTLRPVLFLSLHTLSLENTAAQKAPPGMRGPPPKPFPAVFTICSISWTLGSPFQLPGKSASVDCPALNSTLRDLQTLQGHQNKAISCVPSWSSQSKLFCLLPRQLTAQVTGSEVVSPPSPLPTGHAAGGWGRPTHFRCQVSNNLWE